MVIQMTHTQKKKTHTDDDAVLADQQQYRYMTVDDMKGLDEEHARLDMTAHNASATAATTTTSGDGPKAEKGESGWLDVVYLQSILNQIYIQSPQSSSNFCIILLRQS